jgi:hypothetical protein
MDKNDGIGFALAIFCGIIFGALVDNMFIGLVLGFLGGFGILKLQRKTL